MSREEDTPSESEVTTDRNRIETWADEHEATPIRRERGGEDTVELVPESERREHHEELTWDDFHRELDENEMVVVRRENESSPFDVLERDELTSHHAIDSEEVEEALLEGETVTATVTETTVIEETLVEEATIESEVIDRETVEETFVDAELITREVDHCEVTDVGGADTMTDEMMLETGYETDDMVGVEVEVDEGWTVTKEVLDRLTIESRVVDTSATETETIESDTLEETIDMRGVQETILQGDLLEGEAGGSDVIESGSIESEWREGEVIETSLLERNTVEEEVSLRKEFSGEIGNGRTVAADTISRQTIESEIAEDEDLDAVVVEEETVVADEDTAVVEEEETVVTEEDTATVEEETVVEGDTGVTEPVAPTQADEGKTVVDATGEEVGMVTEVEANTLYVDPHPSLTDRIKTVLDWGGHDDDAYPLEPENVANITDDEVQLAIEEDTDRM